jgi:hypothetical protein
MNESCSNCKFFLKNTNEYQPGLGQHKNHIDCGRCRRYPMDVSDLDCYEPDMWCGEWKAKV